MNIKQLLKHLEKMALLAEIIKKLISMTIGQ